MADEEVTGTEQAAQIPQGQDGQAAQQQFVLQRVYIKDLSFESPVAPGVFKQEWKPAMSVDLRSKSSVIDGDNYEVVLTITITAKLDEETAFLVEVQQAGIFFVRGIEGEELRRVLSIFCPNMLFPYARETIDSIVIRGTFPALMLAQVNFDALYQQALQQSQQQAEAAATAGEAAAGSPAADSPAEAGPTEEAAS